MSRGQEIFLVCFRALKTLVIQKKRRKVCEHTLYARETFVHPFQASENVSRLRNPVLDKIIKKQKKNEKATLYTHQKPPKYQFRAAERPA
jgi:hypothetical protein